MHSEFSFTSRLILYALLILIALYALGLMVWQIHVIRGEVMPNPDGTFDDWHKFKMLYGIAWADVLVACPLALVGVALVFVKSLSRYGYYVVSLFSFFLVWINIATTTNSLRFENPKITLEWLIVFPSGIVVGAAYIVWTLVHFDLVFAPPSRAGYQQV